MRCISVYTNNYEHFSDIYEQIIELDLQEDEERELEGTTVSDAGVVPADYLEKMRQKPEVAVMRIKKRGIIILQHADVFEILLPDENDIVDVDEDEDTEETA